MNGEWKMNSNYSGYMVQARHNNGFRKERIIDETLTRVSIITP